MIISCLQANEVVLTSPSCSNLHLKVSVWHHQWGLVKSLGCHLTENALTSFHDHTNIKTRASSNSQTTQTQFHVFSQQADISMLLKMCQKQTNKNHILQGDLRHWKFQSPTFAPELKFYFWEEEGGGVFTEKLLIQLLLQITHTRTHTHTHKHTHTHTHILPLHQPASKWQPELQTSAFYYVSSAGGGEGLSCWKLWSPTFAPELKFFFEEEGGSQLAKTQSLNIATST